jgi:hypothetical protein
MNRIFTFLIIIAFCICACSSKTSVSVARNPIIKFTSDSISWVDNSYFTTGPAKIVAYPLIQTFLVYYLAAI